MGKPSLGLGIVSWKSHETLRATLHTHRETNLAGAVDQAMVWFQDFSDDDLAVAREFGVQAEGGENCGVAEGMAKIATTLQTDLILFLENDCPVVESAEEVRTQLERARRLFSNDILDVLRLRHRWDVGDGFQLRKYFAFYPPHHLHSEFSERSQLEGSPSPAVASLRRLLRPGKASHLSGRGIYAEKFPERVHRSRIQRHATEDELFLTDSRYLNWTNQSVVTRRDFFLDPIMAYVRRYPSRRTSNGFQSPERPLNCSWWRRQCFRIGVGRGLFTHRRFDGSWRAKGAA